MTEKDRKTISEKYLWKKIENYAFQGVIALISVAPTVLMASAFTHPAVYLESSQSEGFYEIIENAHIQELFPEVPNALKISDRIIKEISRCLKQKRAVPDFSFVQGDLASIHILFHLLDYLYLSDFQRQYLEPFNKKFPNITLSKAPQTIRKLDLQFYNMQNIDFSRFSLLEEIDLRGVQNVSSEQIEQLSVTLKKLSLSGAVGGVDFSRFSSLEEMDLSYAKNLTPEQIGQLPVTLKKLSLSGTVEGVDFSHFSSLEEIDLSDVEALIPRQVTQLPTTLKKLFLSGDVAGVDFSFFSSLEEIDFYDMKNLAPRQIAQLPTTLKKLSLSGDVAGVDFSRFSSLEEVDLAMLKTLLLGIL